MFPNRRTFATKEEKLKYYEDWKCNYCPENECAGLPYEMLIYLKYSLNLNMKEVPDYDYLKGIFKTLLKK